MAVTKESTRSLAGIPTRTIVNTETGAADLYSDEGIFGRTLIASGSAIGNNWTVNDAFVKKYNNRNGTNLSQQELQQVFSNQYQGVVNNDRANIINQHSPYNTKRYLQEKANIPGVINPDNGKKTGDTTSTPTTADKGGNTGSGDTGSGDTGDTEGSTDAAEGEPNAEIEGVPNARTDYGNIVFPNEVRGGAQGLIKFTVLKYNPKGPGAPMGSVTLPASNGLSDNNSIDWAGQRLDAVKAELANIAMSTAEGGKEGFQGSAEAAVDKILQERKVASSFARNALIGNALGVDQQLFTRETGAIINPNLELLFSGPALRQFQFQFKLSARNSGETQEIASIIKFFKQGSAVQRSKANLFLKSPNTFNIEYIHRGGTNPYINLIKECALQSVSVNYTPEGTYAVHPDGAMISYEISLAFSELEPVFEDEYTGHPIGY
jgi:hypothetical protein